MRFNPVDRPRRLGSRALLVLGLLPAPAIVGAIGVTLGVTLAATVAGAQTTTGTVRGTVTAAGGAPAVNAQIEARNTNSGALRRALTRDDGSFVLAGLIPARYEMSVRQIGAAPTTRSVTVQIGATQIQNFALETQATTLQTVQVNAASATRETRTSEVATNVSQAQIQKLPTPSRNFLDLAVLTPGVTVTEDRVSGQTRTFSAGGQSANQVNLFVDGTSLKNDLTAGGIAGQDASRGNPFPRGAIQEYRVITQNFKAEYQKASSAIITATTKSGGNTWSGNALVGYQNAGLVGLDYYQRKDKAANPNSFVRPDYNRTLTSFSLGGPIVRDKVHFFGNYEGNQQNRANRVNFVPTPTGFPALDSVNLARYNGNFGSPFRENQFFAKLDGVVNENSTWEINGSNRHETDVRDFGGNTSFASAVNYRENISTGQLKYNWFKGGVLNEAKVDYSDFRRNPAPNDAGVASRDYQYGGIDAIIGGNRSTQDFVQKRTGLRDDFTYTGFRLAGDHVFKSGASIDFVKYDILKDNNGTPQFTYTNFRTCDPNCADTAVYGFRTPYQLVYGTGDPKINANNRQIGAYLQDDWTPVQQLTLNLGIRWDYESNMLNSGYVTPQSVADTLRLYNSKLAVPLDLNRYISTGKNRPGFKKAFQPRFGFSYAVDKQNRTTVFGGWGKYYDRVPFDLYAVDPVLKIRHPDYTIRFAAPGQTPKAGQVAFDPSYLTADKATLDALVHSVGLPEAWLIDNEQKVPHSTQMNLGIRQLIGSFAVSATYADVRAVDLPGLGFGNAGSLKPDGSCCANNGFDIGAHGFSNFIYSTSDKKTWYKALQGQVDRPYRRAQQSSIGWGAGLAYTYAKRYVAGADGLDDDFDYPNSVAIQKHLSNDEKQRIVTNFIVDVPYAFGIQASGLLTLGGQYRLDAGGAARFNGTGTTGNKFQAGGFTVPGTFPYRNLDVRLRKDFPSFGRDNLSYGVTLDVFNATNRTNFGCYQVGDRAAKDAKGNLTFGTPSCVVSDARRYQLGAEVNF